METVKLILYAKLTNFISSEQEFSVINIFSMVQYREKMIYLFFISVA